MDQGTKGVVSMEQVGLGTQTHPADDMSNACYGPWDYTGANSSDVYPYVTSDIGISFQANPYKATRSITSIARLPVKDFIRKMSFFCA